MRPKHRGIFSTLREAIAGYATDLVYDRKTGVLATFLGFFLWLLSLVFEVLVKFRLWLYRHRLIRDTHLGLSLITI